MTYINQTPKEFAAQSAKFRKLYRDDAKEEGHK